MYCRFRRRTYFTHIDSTRWDNLSKEVLFLDPPCTATAKVLYLGTKEKRIEMPRKKKTKETIIKLPHQLDPCNFDCFEGERLSYLLQSIKKELDVERDLNKSLPNKLWLKQQFAVGVNEVTRVLERMPPSVKNGDQQKPDCGLSIRLQAVFVAWDCNPRWLIRHLPSLAASRDLPIFFVKDHKQGSIRLGELVGMRTAIAVGIKAKGSRINNVVESILSAVELTSAEKLS